MSSHWIGKGRSPGGGCGAELEFPDMSELEKERVKKRWYNRHTKAWEIDFMCGAACASTATATACGDARQYREE